MGEWTIASDGTRMRLDETDGGDLAVSVEFDKGASLRLCTVDDVLLGFA